MVAIEKQKKTTVSQKMGKETSSEKKKPSSRKVAVKNVPEKAAVRKAPRKKSSVASAVKDPVTNKKINGMIQTNLSYASQAKRPVFVDSEVMPVDYGSTSITLLARDPHWAHAYWEIAPSSIEDLRRRIGNTVDQSAHILRVYDVTLIEFNGQNANHWFDIDVGPFANNWYINLWNDNITCCVDIGLRTPDGTFHTLARSNFVTTPREYLSSRHELIWMEVSSAEEEARPYVYVGREPDGKTELVRKDGRRFRIYLTEDDIRAYYSRLFPLLSKILARRRNKNGKALGGGVDADGDMILEYLEEMDSLGYDYFRKMILGASEEMMVRGRKFFEILGGASEAFAPSSWGGASEQVPSKDFFFELGTELIVYGRTEPDAVVFWGDRVIPLREDGTFTLRMGLPTDTNIPLDFKAVSYAKELQRSITTAAGRDKTEYNQ